MVEEALAVEYGRECREDGDVAARCARELGIAVVLLSELGVAHVCGRIEELQC
jgi:hypothetical protein